MLFISSSVLIGEHFFRLIPVKFIIELISFKYAI